MRKHHLRNRIKSIVGSHIDPDKDEDLKGSNIETEDNYKKILELLKEDNQDDKDKLAGLIEDFHKRYQSIYERYDNITGKLKEKVLSKKANTTSSSSSSDSDDSSNKKESKNGMVEYDNSIIADNLNAELESANTEIEELKRKLAGETEEKEALNLQYQAALNKVRETEKMFNDSKLEADRFHEENSKLLAELENISREKVSLISEKETAMTTIEELRAIKEGFESELEDIKGEFYKTKEKLKTSEEETIQKLEITEAENKSLLLKVLEFSDEMKRLENDLQSKQQILEITEAENKSLSLKVLEFSDETKRLENDLQSKQQIVEELEETIEDLKTDLEIKGDEFTTLTETVRNLEVKIRLSNQKLRVTEQTLTETEHDHATKEAKLHEENKILTEKTTTLSETISFIKNEVREKVNEAVKAFDSLTVKFEEDYGHAMTRVGEIRNEVEAVRIQARGNRLKIEDLRREFEERVGRLSEVIVEKDEKIKELGDVICVKDEEVLGVGEEKREVIRQLCVWGEYQRDRCGLKPAVKGGGRR